MPFITFSTPANFSKNRLIVYWLALCMLMVVCVVASDSVVRLSESGHSLEAFRPDIMFYPPQDDPDNKILAQTFAQYQSIEAFKDAFPDISIEDFRHMFWLEYVHSVLQWLMRALFLLPFIWIIARYKHYEPFIGKLTIIFILAIGQQAASSFYIDSTLVNDIDVRVYALMLERGMSFILFSVILWQLLIITHPGSGGMGSPLPPPPLYLQIMGCLSVLFIALQMIGGISMEALHAGVFFNTFPLMDGQWIPDGILLFPLEITSLVEDIPTVQFFHRIMSYGMGLYLVLFWALGRNNPHVAHLLLILFCLYVVQFLFGVLSLLFMVPVPLEAMHQAGAMLLLAVGLTVAHRLLIPLKTIAFDMDARPGLL